jgi:hypothetical protein
MTGEPSLNVPMSVIVVSAGGAPMPGRTTSRVVNWPSLTCAGPTVAGRWSVSDALGLAVTSYCPLSRPPTV